MCDNSNCLHRSKVDICMILGTHTSTSNTSNLYAIRFMRAVGLLRSLMYLLLRFKNHAAFNLLMVVFTLSRPRNFVLKLFFWQETQSEATDGQ